MNNRSQMHSPGHPGTAAAAALLLIGSWVPAAGAQDANSAPAADNSIVASLGVIPQGLTCSAAASQAQVAFDFQKPEFDIKQISLYVDGHGVPQDGINQQWPRVTLISGLHEGRNTVEIVATGDNNKSVARQLTVLIGAPAQAGDENAAVVQCDSSQSQVAATPPPVAEAPQQVIESAPPPTEVPSTVYVDQPVYIYHTVPAYTAWSIFVPFIPVVIGYPPYPTWYGPRPYWHWPAPVVSYYPAPPRRIAPPAFYRPPPQQSWAGSNPWHTAYPPSHPVGGPPMPIHGVPTPFQPSASPPYRGTSQPVGASHPPRAEQSPWAPPQDNRSEAANREPPRQTYVHAEQAPHYEAPRSMSPPRMTSGPAYRGSSHGGWH